MTEPDVRRLSLAAKLKELGARFIERNIGDLAALDASFERLRAGIPGAHAEIESIAHRISGTGATLGFTEISEAAETVERRAENGAELDCIADALDQLRGAVARGKQRA